MIGERIEAARNAAKLTRAQLAEACGINTKTLGTYERGSRNPDPDLIAKICEVLNVSGDYLLGLPDLPNRQQPNPDLRPEQLEAVKDISEIVSAIGRLDLAAGYPRNCLPTVLFILEQILELQAAVDDAYQQAREQHPAFDLALDYDEARRRIRIKARSGDPEALDFIAGEDYFEKQTRWLIEQTAGQIFDLLAVDLFNDFRDKIGADVPVFHRIITTGRQDGDC